MRNTARGGSIAKGSAAEKRAKEQVVMNLGLDEAAQLTAEGREAAEGQEDLAAAIAELGRIGSIDNLLSFERWLLDHQLEYKANTPVMEGSLETAIAESERAVATLAMLRDPATYRILDQGIQSPKRRAGGLPLDDARMFFTSHAARIQNLEKAVGSLEEKQVLQERRNNLIIAGSTYRAMQKRVLGVTKEKSTAKNNNNDLGR